MTVRCSQRDAHASMAHRMLAAGRAAGASLPPVGRLGRTRHRDRRLNPLQLVTRTGGETSSLNPSSSPCWSSGHYSRGLFQIAKVFTAKSTAEPPRALAQARGVGWACANTVRFRVDDRLALGRSDAIVTMLTPSQLEGQKGSNALLALGRDDDEKRIQ